VPYSETFLKNAAGKIRRSKPCRYSKEYSETIYTANENGALPRDVIEISTLAGGKGGSERFFYCKTCNKFCSPKEKTTHLSHKIIQHPTQKPLELTEKLIKAAKPKGEFNVLIPFSGSGSECVVCKKMRGNYTAFEINKDYVKLANEWLKTK
jgi:site-specific DNA-methyltransferase (adenine-specific)